MSSTIVADLHSHTIASDGELSPEALVDLALKAGLEALAVTDHDAIEAVDRAIAQGKSVGVEVVPGCELTVYEGECELHVLGLFIDHHSPAFVKLLKDMQDQRRIRALAMAEKLRASGIAIDDADIIACAGEASSIGRPHVAEALVRRGHASSINAAFINFLGRDSVGYVPKFKLSPDAAFQAVRASGGVSILAHPGSTKHDELIAPLFRRGLDGVEANYPSHSFANHRFYSGLARRYEKLVSGGSDYHGPVRRPDTQVGDSGVDRQTYNQIRRLHEARVHRSESLTVS